MARSRCHSLMTRRIRRPRHFAAALASVRRARAWTYTQTRSERSIGCAGRVQRYAGERSRGQRRGVGSCAVEPPPNTPAALCRQVPSVPLLVAVARQRCRNSMMVCLILHLIIHCQCLLAAFSRTGDLITSHLISSFVIGSHFSRRCPDEEAVSLCYSLRSRSMPYSRRRSRTFRTLPGSRGSGRSTCANSAVDFGRANDSCCGHGTPHRACFASTIPPSSVELSLAFLTAVKQRNRPS